MIHEPLTAYLGRVTVQLGRRNECEPVSFLGSLGMLRMCILSLVLFCLHSWSVASSAVAQNFDNGNPIPVAAGLPVDISSDDVFPLHVLDDFALPPTAPTISRIMWFGVHTVPLGTPAPVREFDIDIYASGVIPWIVSPTPIYSVRGISPARSFITSGGVPMTSGPYPVYLYDFHLGRTLTLTPNATYWITIRAASSPGVTFADAWYWSHSTTSGGNTQVEMPGITSGFVPTVSLFPAHNKDVAFKLFP